MKNKKTLFISFKDLSSLEHETLDVLKAGKGHLQPTNVIYFDSLKSFRVFLTVQKLELLAVIASQNPSSVYELAKSLSSDVAPVQRDCTVLANTGFIVLKDSKSTRKAKLPRLKFDYNCLVVQLPKLSYELKFDAAA
jgi:predicted transcriptional regulator